MIVALTDEGPLAKNIARELKGDKVIVVDTPQKVLTVRPEVVVHTLEVPFFENRAHMWNYNTWYSVNIARASNKVGATNVYFSTFMIFDGKKGYYHENSTPNPINFYGVSKLAGEVGVTALGNYLVLRVGALYSLNSRGFLFPFFKAAFAGRNLRCNKNFYVSPISLHAFSKVVSRFIHEQIRGIINVAGPRISLYEMCGLIADLFGVESIGIDGQYRDFSLDTWLLNSFNIKISLKEDLVDAIEHRILNDEGKDIPVA
ncbi:MAG: sugar nucleotide-binding protein [Candidatus Aramenus sp.]|jgi:dTDP-4-dehydrorhamnose reductase|nr:sugar nucleotide-binding protein [Candidatus Aramenus sp.]